MLKRNSNQMKCENWSISNYQYDSASYNPDTFDMVPFGDLCSAYSRVCAQMTSASSKISTIGHVTNSANVKNVDIGSLKTQCLGNLSSELNSMVDNFGGFVNAVAINTAANDKLFLPDGGKNIDNIAEYLKGYSSEYADAIISDDGSNIFAAFGTYDFGNGLDYSADASKIPTFSGPITDENGNVTDEYRAYVESVFGNFGEIAIENEKGEREVIGNVTITNLDENGNIPINPANGNVQVEFKASDGTTFTINCNLTNPQALSNAYVSLPGTPDITAPKYGGLYYNEFINSTQYNADNKYMSAVVEGTGHHDVANVAISQIFGSLIGRETEAGHDNQLNKSVVSAASASENLVLDTAYELMDISKRIDIMLIDAAADNTKPGGSVFVQQLIGDKLVSQQKGGMPVSGASTKLPDGRYIYSDPYAAERDKYNELYNYFINTGSVIYSYESINGIGNSPNCDVPDPWYQLLANNDLNVVMCLNSDYKAHTNPEYNIFSGELERVMSGFDIYRPVTNSNNEDGFQNIQSEDFTYNYENPYIVLNDLTDDQIAMMTFENNRYAIYQSGGNGVINVSVLEEGAESSLADLYYLNNGHDDSNNQ